MSVTAVRPLHSGRAGMAGADNKRTYNITYQVQTDDPQDGAAVVLVYFAANGLGYGAVYTYGNDVDLAAYCTSVVPRQLDDRRFWEVVVTFERMPSSSSKDKDGNPVTDPVNKHPELRVGFAQFSEELVSGKFLRRETAAGVTLTPDRGPQSYLVPLEDWGLINTANDPLPDVLYRDRSDLVCMFTFYESEYNADLALQFQDTINESPVDFAGSWWNFLGTWDESTAKVQNISGEFIFDNGYKYWRNTYEIHVRRDKWVVRAPNRGFFRYAGPTAYDLFGSTFSQYVNPGYMASRMIQDAKGFSPNEPVYLDDIGQPSQSNGAPVQANYLVFDAYSKQDFAQLNLVYTGAATGGGSGGQSA